MVSEPIGQRFDHARPAAFARLCDRASGDLMNGDHVVAVDLMALHARRDGLLRQRLRRRLRATRHGDRPLIVVDHDHERCAPNGREVQGLVEVPFGRAAIADQADGDARLAPLPKGVSGTGRVRDLSGDRHTARKIGTRRGKGAAPLVAAPVEQALDHGDAAQQLRAVIAIRWRKHVLRTHRARHPDADGLLTDRGGERAELSGSLQSNRLGVEGPRQGHGAMEPQQRLRIARENRSRLRQLAFGREELRKVDPKLDAHGDRLPEPTSTPKLTAPVEGCISEE